MDAVSQLAALRAQSPHILFVIGRSKNLNIVVYEAKMEGGELDSSEPVSVYWLDIDPAYAAAARAKGVKTDRVELGALEKRLAYGLSSSPLAGRAGHYSVRLVAFPDRVVTVAVDAKKGRPVASMTINGTVCELERIFVTATESWINPLPSVQHVDVTGVDAHGKRVTERIIPK